MFPAKVAYVSVPQTSSCTCSGKASTAMLSELRMENTQAVEAQPRGEGHGHLRVLVITKWSGP